MSDPYANMPAPVSGGDFPDQYKFVSVGQSVEGVLTDSRWKEANGDIKGCQILQVRQADGTEWSVFCGPTSLHREVFNKRPPIGSMVRITFNGYDGQAKLFTLDVAPGPAAAAPQSAPAPAQEAAPQGWAQPQAAAPAPAPAAAPAAPWGQ